MNYYNNKNYTRSYLYIKLEESRGTETESWRKVSFASQK